MKQLISTALAIALAVAWQPIAHAQFGSGIVFDPTQAGHAVTQIENEQRSLANEVRQIEQGQQIFTNTVRCHHSAASLHIAKQQYDLTHRMSLAPRILYARFCLQLRLAATAADLEHVRQFDGVAQLRDTGNGAEAAYQQVNVPNTTT